jgi:hypothetical protein
MVENESVFPSLEKKFLGISKAKTRGWISLGQYAKTIRRRHFWTSCVRSILNSDPDSLRNFRAQNIRNSQGIKNIIKDSHPGIFTTDSRDVK